MDIKHYIKGYVVFSQYLFISLKYMDICNLLQTPILENNTAHHLLVKSQPDLPTRCRPKANGGRSTETSHYLIARNANDSQTLKGWQQSPLPYLLHPTPPHTLRVQGAVSACRTGPDNGVASDSLAVRVLSNCLFDWFLGW